MNHVLFCTMWMAICLCVIYLVKRGHQDALWEKARWWRKFDALDNVLLQNLRPCTLVYLNLTGTMNLNSDADKVHPFMAFCYTYKNSSAMV